MLSSPITRSEIRSDVKVPQLINASLEQHRSTDSLEPSNSDHSFSDRKGCFSYLYDFFISLFRYLFCMSKKEKITISSQELMQEQTKAEEIQKQTKVKDIQEQAKAEEIQEKRTLKEFLVATRHDWSPWGHESALKEAVLNFKAQEESVQNEILHYVALHQMYVVVKLYLDILPPKRQEKFEEFYGRPFALTEISRGWLLKIFNAGF